MTVGGQLLAAFSLYGLPVLFGVVLLGSAGLPIPGVVVVIAAGALVRLGEMNLWWVLSLTCSGAVLGDNLAYAIGRTGGRRLARRITARIGGERRIQQAEALSMKWGGLGIFLSRWLLTPVGAPLNFVSGMTAYPHPRFLLFDVTGQILWTVEYVLLGELLSDRIATLLQLLGQLPWLALGLIGAVVFGRGLAGYLRKRRR